MKFSKRILVILIVIAILLIFSVGLIFQKKSDKPAKTNNIPTQLVGEWKAFGDEKGEIDDDETFNIAFNNGKITGKLCNSFSAEIKSVTVNELYINEVSQSQMHCEGRIMELEDKFTSILNHAGGVLVYVDTSGAVSYLQLASKDKQHYFTFNRPTDTQK